MKIDLPWIAKQMRAEADVIDGKVAPTLDHETPTCYWCGEGGPGLYWLPSEIGIIEMATWNCRDCIVTRP